MRAESVRIGAHALPGELVEVPGEQGIVVFAHGSGSSRLSPRNRQVAAALQRHALGTLLFDLLTPDEADDRRLVFDILLLADRLVGAIDWLRARPALAGRRIGLFGASTGAPAAPVLGQVRAPTLLIVGGDDTEVLALNRAALQGLRGEKRLAVVPGATHLFEEPGALEAVARLAADWFTLHLPRRPT